MNSFPVPSPAVDIVYLWVNGADEQWQTKRRQSYRHWQKAHGADLAIYGNIAGRYRDNGELRFNLRCLERFFPDHGHVYLVTDGQKPHWLKAGPGLTVVDHAELMPANLGGVYDSGHIESYLHHIPGLSEHFIYLNDDVFFGAPVDTAWWFSPQLKVFLEDEELPDFSGIQPSETALVNASLLSRDWLSNAYQGYRHEPRVFTHAPRPMLKSLMFELERLAPQLFADVRSTTFRSWRIPPIVPDFVPRWMVHQGFAEALVFNPLHIGTGDPDVAHQLERLQTMCGSVPFFCINDTSDDAPQHDEGLMRVQQAFEQLMPEPSSFEVSHARVKDCA